MNKNIWTMALAAAIALPAAGANPSETYFSCQFDETMPADFVTADNDNAELHFTMQQLGFDARDSWRILREEGTMNYYAASASRFKVAKGETAPQASDWLITPAVWVKGADARLTWRAMTFNDRNQNAATYNVYVSTTGQSVADFTDAPVATITYEEILKWTDRSVDLSAYEGKRIYIAFVNTSYDSDVLAIDDICVTGGKGFASIEVAPGDYAVGGEKVTISGSVTALSDEPINSVVLTCTVDGMPQSEAWRIERSGLNLSQGEKFEFAFDNAIETNYGDTFTYHLTARVNDVDFDPIDRTTTVLAFIPTKRIVVEKVTGMWCGYCPKGVIAMETLAENYPDSFIGIAIHQGDKLLVEGYGDTMPFPKGAPTGWIDRVIYNENPMVGITSAGKQTYTTLMGGFETSYLDRLKDQPLADVDVEATLVDDNTLSVNVSSSYAINFNDVDYRIVLVLTEDHVWREGYYQTNYFSGGIEQVFGYESLPRKIEGDYEFNHVARAVYGGDYLGQKGSVPSRLEAGKRYEYSVDWSLPADMGKYHNAVTNHANAKVVAMIVNAASGEVLNANTAVYADAASIDAVEAAGQLDATLQNGVLEVSGSGEINMTVTDLSGRVVATASSRGTLSADLSALSGVMLINVSTDSATRTIKFVNR